MGEVSSTFTVAQCPVNDVADTTPPSVPDRDGTSPGILGQTASPSTALPPAHASGQKADLSLEASARSAVAVLIEETSKPASDQHAARLKVLRNEALCAAGAYLKSQQEHPSDRNRLAHASRLLHQAKGTVLGLAATAEDVALKKYSDLFSMTRRLENRSKDQRSVPLNGEERRVVHAVIVVAREAAERNVVAWEKANASNANSNSEPYGNARTCVRGLASAEETRNLVSISAARAEQLVRQLEQ